MPVALPRKTLNPTLRLCIPPQVEVDLRAHREGDVAHPGAAATAEGGVEAAPVGAGVVLRVEEGARPGSRAATLFQRGYCGRGCGGSARQRPSSFSFCHSSWKTYCATAGAAAARAREATRTFRRWDHVRHLDGPLRGGEGENRTPDLGIMRPSL